jgi:hypothetical protein
MVDWEKQKKFQLLAEKLGASLGKRYGVEFSFDQAYNANRFSLRSKRPAKPYYELEFSTEEQLAVAVSDGEHVPAFYASTNLSHCLVMYEDGWNFNYEPIEQAAIRLLDLGKQFFEEQEGSTRKSLPGSYRQAY